MIMHTWEWILVGVGVGLIPFCVLAGVVVHTLVHMFDGL